MKTTIIKEIIRVLCSALLAGLGLSASGCVHYSVF